MREATIVIPTKRVDLLERAIRSVLATHERLDWCQFLVIDDGLTSRPALCDGLTYLEGRKPFSFAANVNIALRHVDGSRDVIVMNDDVECLTPEGMSRLRRAAYQRPRAGLLTPVFIGRGWRPTRASDGERAAEEETWIEMDHFLIFPVGYFRRDLIEAVGLLDESLAGYGYDDNDYCLRTRLADFELIVVPNVVMAHGDDDGPGVSFRKAPDFNEIFSRNQETFVRKWGTSLLGLTPNQAQRLLWFIRFNFQKSVLAARAAALLELERGESTDTHRAARA